jgi:hypothetical protein
MTSMKLKLTAAAALLVAFSSAALAQSGATRPRQRLKRRASGSGPCSTA